MHSMEAGSLGVFLYGLALNGCYVLFFGLLASTTLGLGKLIKNTNLQTSLTLKMVHCPQHIPTKFRAITTNYNKHLRYKNDNSLSLEMPNPSMCTSQRN